MINHKGVGNRFHDGTAFTLSQGRTFLSSKQLVT